MYDLLLKNGSVFDGTGAALVFLRREVEEEAQDLCESCRSEVKQEADGNEGRTEGPAAVDPAGDRKGVEGSVQNGRGLTVNPGRDRACRGRPWLRRGV